ncbi:MAG TPA: PAS domain S-box protein [Nitrospiraceae bacterium]|nr:PAS domain S-box protein [Nitrospiraceae bacterium]
MLNAGSDESSGETHIHDLEQSAELFRLLVDRVRDYAIFALDLNGCIVTWNSGAELLKGYCAEEIIGQHIKCFYTEADRQADKPLQLLKRAREQGRVQDEGWRVRRDGSQFWANVTITALVDEKGSLRGYAKVTRDLTERRQTEEALRESKNELEKRVLERTAQFDETNTALQERLAELEQFHDVVVGRELKLIELEKEIQHLQREIERLKEGR